MKYINFGLLEKGSTQNAHSGTRVFKTRVPNATTVPNEHAKILTESQWSSMGFTIWLFNIAMENHHL